MPHEMNIAETLIDDPKFSIFVKGLASTRLIDKLHEKGPFTVMAPTNLAFTKLPEWKLIELMKPLNRENLAEVMKHHLIEGVWMSEDIIKFAAIGSLQNQKLTIETSGCGFRVGGADSQSRNIKAVNGVIHCINAVIFPAKTTKTL